MPRTASCEVHQSQHPMTQDLPYFNSRAVCKHRHSNVGLPSMALAISLASGEEPPIGRTRPRATETAWLNVRKTMERAKNYRHGLYAGRAKQCREELLLRRLMRGELVEKSPSQRPFPRLSVLARSRRLSRSRR